LNDPAFDTFKSRLREKVHVQSFGSTVTEGEEFPAVKVSVFGEAPAESADQFYLASTSAPMLAKKTINT
jgi:hypothetical protein